MQTTATTRVRIWDPAVRLFHWSIVLLVGFSWWTANTGRMQWHFLSGFTILALVLFRLVWGVVGSDSARFSRFLRSPIAALRHLAEFPRAEPDRELGHNAAGGWMVLLMLGLLLAQATTGLFADTGYGDYGPLAKAVGAAASDRLTTIHHRIIAVLLGVIVLHVCAVAAYALLKGHDLVSPMVTGAKVLPAGTSAPRLRSPLLALGILGLTALAVVGLSRLG